MSYEADDGATFSYDPHFNDEVRIESPNGGEARISAGDLAEFVANEPGMLGVLNDRARELADKEPRASKGLKISYGHIRPVPRPADSLSATIRTEQGEILAHVFGPTRREVQLRARRVARRLIPESGGDPGPDRPDRRRVGAALYDVLAMLKLRYPDRTDRRDLRRRANALLDELMPEDEDEDSEEHRLSSPSYPSGKIVCTCGWESDSAVLPEGADRIGGQAVRHMLWALQYDREGS